MSSDVHLSRTGGGTHTKPGHDTEEGTGADARVGRGDLEPKIHLRSSSVASGGHHKPRNQRDRVLLQKVISYLEKEIDSAKGSLLAHGKYQEELERQHDELEQLCSAGSVDGQRNADSISSEPPGETAICKQLGETIAVCSIGLTIDQLVIDALEGCATAAPRTADAMPRELWSAGRLFTPLFWQALDAQGRHWLKRRIGKYQTPKLVKKMVEWALLRAQERLRQAGHDDLSMDELWSSAESWGTDMDYPWGKPKHS